ncbi:MAG: hypothetical protein L3J74_02000 [Bacteroidales bacterium]|nr:hypothetical protein [Bacteroidales bacterium]
MIWLKKYFLALIILSFLINIQIFAQDETVAFGSDSIVQEYYFGFNLNPSLAGGLVNFALVKPLANGKRKIILLSQDNFVYQAKGKMKSLANPYKIDFFKKYNITNLSVLDNLWKLRYTEYPYKTTGKAEKGWSQNLDFDYMPTAGQMEMLKKFGIENLRDYFYGENAFRLLEAIQNPQWLKTYKEAY